MDCVLLVDLVATLLTASFHRLQELQGLDVILSVFFIVFDFVLVFLEYLLAVYLKL